MKSLPVALGQTIRELRTAAGFSQERFAAAAGVHRTFMGDVERGEANPSLKTLEGIAKGLGVTVAELVGEAERSLHR
jgi:transcriptional regulator with XRE-family HTH domain